MTDAEFEATLDNLDKNLAKIEQAMLKKGLTQVSLATVIAFRTPDSIYRSGTARLGSPQAVKGTMLEYIRGQSV